MNTLQRLSDWKYSHKSHSCSIEHCDGYGASCWAIDLRGVKNDKYIVVHAIEHDYRTYQWYKETQPDSHWAGGKILIDNEKYLIRSLETAASPETIFVDSKIENANSLEDLINGALDVWEIK